VRPESARLPNATAGRSRIGVTRGSGQAPAALADRAETFLSEEMADAAAAVAGEKIADLILPVRLPTSAAQMAGLKSDLHDMILAPATAVPRLPDRGAA
jgi:hypothetical protein